MAPQSIRWARSRPTLMMRTASMIYASTHGRVTDRLEQLEHPALHRTPLPQGIIEHPRGELISMDEAVRRFHSVMEEAA